MIACLAQDIDYSSRISTFFDIQHSVCLDTFYSIQTANSIYNGVNGRLVKFSLVEICHSCIMYPHIPHIEHVL